MTDNPDRIERTLELLLYAPLGIGMFLKETAPSFVDMFVSRGRAEIDRRHDDVQQRVTTARSLGQVALAFGAPKLREHVERTVAGVYHRAEGLLGSAASSSAAPSSSSPSSQASSATPPAPTRPAPAQSSAPPAAPEAPSTAGEAGWSGWSAATPPAPTADPAVTANGGSNGDDAARAELPIPGYDALSASQVVERLIGLAPDELAAVHDYESSHRQRRTILGKIEQLAG